MSVIDIMRKATNTKIMRGREFRERERVFHYRSLLKISTKQLSGVKRKILAVLTFSRLLYETCSTRFIWKQWIGHLSLGMIQPLTRLLISSCLACAPHSQVLEHAKKGQSIRGKKAVVEKPVICYNKFFFFRLGHMTKLKRSTKLMN